MKTQYKRFDSSTQVDEWYTSYKKFFPSEDGEDKGFLSTTLLRESIRDFVCAHSDLNVLLEISIPKGTNGIYVGHLECTEDKYEIILPPKTKLCIDNKMPIFNTYFQCTVIR